MTRLSIEHRWKEHKQDYKRKNTHLYNAMLKYGIENFQIEQIEECPQDQLVLREAYWIKHYDSYNNGYNMTEGKGEGNSTSFNARPVKQYSLSGTFIAQYSSCGEAEAKTGIKCSNIQKVALGERKTAGGFQWKFLEDNTPVLSVQAHPGGGKGKTVLQYDKEWNLINTYPSSRAAALALGKKNQSLSSSWFKDNKLHEGYYWKFKENEY